MVALLLSELDAERDSILQAASVTLLPNSFRRPGGWLGFLLIPHVHTASACGHGTAISLRPTRCCSPHPQPLSHNNNRDEEEVSGPR